VIGWLLLNAGVLAGRVWRWRTTLFNPLLENLTTFACSCYVIVGVAAMALVAQRTGTERRFEFKGRSSADAVLPRFGHSLSLAAN
jgi:hypothetical protein